jgi:hypothetical protein
MVAVVLLLAALTGGAPSLDHAACVRALTPPKIAGPGDLASARRLQTPMLKALLVGHVLRDPSSEPPTVYDISYLEWFHADGSWTHHGGRGGVDSGRYRIEGDQVCVMVQRTTRCRTMWATAEGNYLTVEATRGGGLQLQPVSIESAETADFARRKPFC